MMRAAIQSHGWWNIHSISSQFISTRKVSKHNHKTEKTVFSDKTQSAYRAWEEHGSQWNSRIQRISTETYEKSWQATTDTIDVQLAQQLMLHDPRALVKNDAILAMTAWKMFRNKFYGYRCFVMFCYVWLYCMLCFVMYC